MSIVENAVYRDGRRLASPATLEQTYHLLGRLRAEDARRGEPSAHRALAWIALADPSDDELASLGAHFGLHELAVEDIRQAGQRPKMERYGSTVLTVLRPAVYRDAAEQVDVGEVHICTGPDFVITVRQSAHDRFAPVRERVEGRPALLSTGAEAVLYALLDQTVDDYYLVVEGLENDVDEISDDLFTGAADGVVSQRIYQLTREVSAFHRAVAPLEVELRRFHQELAEDEAPLELRHGLRDVLDHLIFVTTKVEAFQSSLANALMLDSTQVAARQNEQMKRISSWAAILFAPSIIGSVYGMNFRHMPELSWLWGYPMALVLMLLTGVALYAVFRRKRWL